MLATIFTNVNLENTTVIVNCIWIFSSALKSNNKINSQLLLVANLAQTLDIPNKEERKQLNILYWSMPQILINF